MPTVLAFPSGHHSHSDGLNIINTRILLFQVHVDHIAFDVGMCEGTLASTGNGQREASVNP
jgi:hypothetical protein